MADHSGDGLSALWQAIIALGLFIGGIMAGLFGRQTRGEERQERSSDADKLRSKLERELLRRDLEAVFSSQRIALEQRVNEFEDKINEKIDALSEERRSAVGELDNRIRDLEIGRRPR